MQVQHTKLASEEEAGRRKAYWAKRLDALSDQLTVTPESPGGAEARSAFARTFLRGSGRDPAVICVRTTLDLDGRVLEEARARALARESVAVQRDAALQGAGSAVSAVDGFVAAAGATTDLTLAALTVDGTAPGVAGCWREALSLTSGARVATAPDVVVLQTPTGGAACRLFADGFESGGVLAWSGHKPP